MKVKLFLLIALMIQSFIIAQQSRVIRKWRSVATRFEDAAMEAQALAKRFEQVSRESQAITAKAIEQAEQARGLR